MKNLNDTTSSPVWLHSTLWLLFLGPFFFLTYGFANSLASTQAITQSLVFTWEHHIPFIPWTIIPYWSIDILYACSFLLCRTKQEVNRHALRLLTAQFISITFFIITPLHFSFQRPHIESIFSPLFDALMSFDQPYNQAPSLHISLLIIIWVRLITIRSNLWKKIIHLWMMLIGLSVLTTYQHHFIDIPTGILSGLFCLWIWPDHFPSPLSIKLNSITTKHYKIGSIYLLSSLLLAWFGIKQQGTWLWMLWISISLIWVAIIYFLSNPNNFQKYNGQHSCAIRILLAPYILGAHINSIWWTRHQPNPCFILDNVWLWHLPKQYELKKIHFSTLLDLTAELPAPHHNWHYINIPCLDLIPLTAEQLREAAHHIEDSRLKGQILVCCALGYSRSACAVLAWLLITLRAPDLITAEGILRAQYPHFILNSQHRIELLKLIPSPIKNSYG